MRKLFLFLVIAALLMTGVAYAANNYASDNVMILSGSSGPSGITPPTVAVKVRYAKQGAVEPGLSSGDIVSWDYISADGITISGVTTDAPGAVGFAGVLITDIPTSDNATTVNPVTRNWGYMAIQGYCLAKVDTSLATTGMPLALNGGTLTKSFRTIGITATLGPISADIGTLLSDVGTDGIMPVWLK